jgi:solute:Na+ symporter, SSS family
MNMVLLVTITTIIYLIVVAYFGYLGYSQTKNATDYLIAGRKQHPVIMALSYGATFISTSAIVGFGGAAAVYGMGLLWLTFLNIFLGIFIAFVIFGKRIRKMGHNLDAHTFPELLGRRFNSRFLQAAAGMLIFVGMPLYAGSVMIGGSQFIAQSFSINYEVALLFFTAIVAIYVIMGGLKGVMYTDAFQGSLMFIGMIILLWFVYAKLGGIVSAHRQLTAMAPKAIEAFGKMGHLGWTSMPAFKSVFWLQLVTTIVMGVGIGVLAQPQLAVRFMTVKSDKEINRAVLVGGVFILMMTGVAFVIGSLTNVFFFNDPAFAKISIAAAAKKVDNIIPLFVNTYLPPWFTAIFMITLLAAAMSTLSSQFHTMGTAFGRDFYEMGLKKKGNPILLTRASMGLGILVSLFLAYTLPKFFEQGSAIIAIGTAIFFGLCGAAFLPMMVGGLFFKKVSKEAAIWSFLGGALMSFFWIAFVHSKESVPLGLCKLFFGMPTLAGVSKWQFLDPQVVSLPVSALVFIVVNMLTKPVEGTHVDRCFAGLK